VTTATKKKKKERGKEFAQMLICRKKISQLRKLKARPKGGKTKIKKKKEKKKKKKKKKTEKGPSDGTQESQQ